MHVRKVMGRSLLALSALAGDASADAVPAPSRLATVDVVAARGVVPTAATRVEVAPIARVAPLVSASELLVNVPGLGVRDRGNLAQDLQVQSRGFGSRASFGIRGLRLLLDDIPVSANDGQGQLANWPLAALEHIELLRGPQALSMGNAAGGVLAAYTARPAAGQPARLRLGAGGNGQEVVELLAQHRADGDRSGVRFDAQSFRTDGERPHAAATRRQAQLLVASREDSARRWHLVGNVLDLPTAEDPLGITPAQWRAGVRTDAAAERFDTRKSVRNAHLGAVWSGPIGERLDARFVAYGGQREVVQFLAVPVAAQGAPTSAGGVVDFARDFSGLIASLGGSAGRGNWRAGVELARTLEARRGYENFVGTTLGVRGRLRRDERNRVDSHDLFASWAQPWARGYQWSITARDAHVAMRSRDRFLGNGDDSGRWRSQALNASATLQHSGAPTQANPGRQWLSLGSGFETPTLNELSYRADGLAGLNTALRAARSRMLEFGMAQRVGPIEIEAALFDVLTRDDIVPALNQGGRASFQNAERVRRRGAELLADTELARGLELRVAATFIDARFERGFAYRVAGETAPRLVRDGARVPGVARLFGGVDLDWTSHDARSSARLSVQGNGRVYADDRNSVVAPGFVRVDIGAARRLADRVELWSRIDNLFDRDAIGSVIVNEANGRHFEPAAGRTFWIGVGWGGAD